MLLLNNAEARALHDCGGWLRRQNHVLIVLEWLLTHLLESEELLLLSARLGLENTQTEALARHEVGCLLWVKNRLLGYYLGRFYIIYLLFQGFWRDFKTRLGLHYVYLGLAVGCSSLG